MSTHKSLIDLEKPWINKQHKNELVVAKGRLCEVVNLKTINNEIGRVNTNKLQHAALKYCPFIIKLAQPLPLLLM